MFVKSFYGKVSVFTGQQYGQGDRVLIWEWPNQVLILGFCYLLALLPVPSYVMFLHLNFLFGRIGLVTGT